MLNKQPGEVQLGDGATKIVGSDRYPLTVIEIKDEGKTLVLQHDNYTALHRGLTENQKYSYAPNTAAATVEVTHRKDGTWIKRGERLVKRGNIRYFIGVREAYWNPSY